MSLIVIESPGPQTTSGEVALFGVMLSHVLTRNLSCYVFPELVESVSINKKALFLIYMCEFDLVCEGSLAGLEKSRLFLPSSKMTVVCAQRNISVIARLQYIQIP